MWACRARGLSRRRRAAASGAIAVPQRSSVCGKRTGGCVRRARACCTLVCGCVRMRACASALHRSATLGVASAGASAPADDPRKVPMESAGPPALLQRMPLRKRVRKEHRHPRTRPARLNSSLAALRSMTSASAKVLKICHVPDRDVLFVGTRDRSKGGGRQGGMRGGVSLLIAGAAACSSVSAFAPHAYFAASTCVASGAGNAVQVSPCTALFAPAQPHARCSPGETLKCVRLLCRAACPRAA